MTCLHPSDPPKVFLLPLDTACNVIDSAQDGFSGQKLAVTLSEIGSTFSASVWALGFMKLCICFS